MRCRTFIGSRRPGTLELSLSDHTEILKTLAKHVNYALNASKTAFVVTAADVECGELTWFANRQVGDIEPTAIRPHHVLASGSIAPQFPWTEISDGEGSRTFGTGLIDNTPLGAAIDAFDPRPEFDALPGHHESVSAQGKAAEYLHRSQ